MTSTNNEHVFPKDGRWIVRRESSKRISKTFENKDDAMEYAGVIAFNDGGSVVLHKHNGQFKKFKHGSEIHV